MSNTEALFSAAQIQQQQEQIASQSHLAEIAQRGRQTVGRIALGLTLAIASGAAAGVGETVAETPHAALADATFSNDYPDMDAVDCSKQFGAYSWCKDRDGNKKFSSDEQNSSRGYGYRNCTDGAAYWVATYTGTSIPGWGDAKSWDNSAPSTDVIAGTTTTDIEPGDIAESEDGGGTHGHVGFVISVTKNADGTVASFKTAEMNRAGNGEYSEGNSYGSRNAAGKFIRDSVYNYSWDHFIDVNGPGKGLNNEAWPSTPTHPAPPPPLPTPLPFGNSGDLPLSGDWAAAGISNVGTWRQGSFYLRNLDGSYTTLAFGNGADTPLSGNWDGPGATQVGSWRNGTFYMRHANGSYETVAYGNATDTPLTGDWNADGHTDLGTWRSGTFSLRAGNGTTTTIVFGNATDIPLTGNWDGPGATQVGVWRNGVFYLRHSNGTVSTIPYGNSTDLPITGDWNADSITDVGVWREGVFWVRE